MRDERRNDIRPMWGGVGAARVSNLGKGDGARYPSTVDLNLRIRPAGESDNLRLPVA